MRHFLLTHRNVKTGEVRESKSRRQEGITEKGRREGKFCLKWVLFT